MKKFSLTTIRNTFLVLLACILLAEGMTALLNDFYFEKIANREVARRQLPKETANAVKHAFAASLVYSGFRAIYFSENAASDATIYLGKVNEIAELIFKKNRDSTLEIMKDLENNLIGIMAAQWLEGRDGEDRLQFIGGLAQDGILVLDCDEIDLPTAEKKRARNSSNYSAAVLWFEENKGRIASTSSP